MPKITSEPKTGRMSLSVTGSVFERLQSLSDVLGQPPTVIASICVGMGLKALEAQVLGMDPRLMAEAAIEYQAKIGMVPLSNAEMMAAMIEGMANLKPEQLARFGITPDQVERVKNESQGVEE